MASGRRVVFGVIALALAGLCSPGAMAQLTGKFRDTFVDSSLKGCLSTAEREHLPVAADTMKAYCTCMADKQADMTTEQDLGYYAAHHELSEDYQGRVRALAPGCKEELGLDK